MWHIKGESESEKSITFWVIFHENMSFVFMRVMWPNFYNVISFHRNFSFSKSTKFNQKLQLLNYKYHILEPNEPRTGHAGAHAQNNGLWNTLQGWYCLQMITKRENAPAESA